MPWEVSVESGEERTRTDSVCSIVRGWAEVMKQQWGLSSAQEREEIEENMR